MMKPNQKLILIVDDDESVAEFLMFTLKKAGFRTEVLGNGEKIKSFISTNNPDLIVLDLMLPGTSGMEIIKQLQADAEFKNIPIVVISGGFESEAIKEMVCFETNVKHYFVKPINPQDLTSKIHSLLGTTTPGKNSEKPTS